MSVVFPADCTLGFVDLKSTGKLSVIRTGYKYDVSTKSMGDKVTLRVEQVMGQQPGSTDSTFHCVWIPFCVEDVKPSVISHETSWIVGQEMAFALQLDADDKDVRNTIETKLRESDTAKVRWFPE